MITKCHGTGCDLKSVCHRYITPAVKDQEYFYKPPMSRSFNPTGFTKGWHYECPDFWVTEKMRPKWNKLSNELKKRDRYSNGG